MYITSGEIKNSITQVESHMGLLRIRHPSIISSHTTTESRKKSRSNQMGRQKMGIKF